MSLPKSPQMELVLLVAERFLPRVRYLQSITMKVVFKTILISLV